MNPILDLYFGKNFIHVIRKDTTRLYRYTSHRNLKIITLIQPELLAYLGIR